MQAFLAQSLFPNGFKTEKAASLAASIVVNLAMIVAFASIANIDGEAIKEGASLVVIGLTGSESESEAAEAKQAPSLPAPPPAAEPDPPSIAPQSVKHEEPIEQKIALLRPAEPAAERPDTAPAKSPPDSQPSPEQMREAAEQQRRAQEAARERAAAQAQSEAKAAASDSAASRTSARSGGAATYGGIVIQHLRRFTRGNSVGAGATLVRIAIDGSGSLREAAIIRSSGSASFDREALQTVRRASPFPKPPGGEGRTINFEFTGR